MSGTNYRRTVQDLRKVASMFWPPALSEEAGRISVIPMLLNTQDEFIAILSVPVSNLRNLYQVIDAYRFQGICFSNIWWSCRMLEGNCYRGLTAILINCFHRVIWNTTEMTNFKTANFKCCLCPIYLMLDWVSPTSVWARIVRLINYFKMWLPFCYLVVPALMQRLLMYYPNARSVTT